MKWPAQQELLFCVQFSIQSSQMYRSIVISLFELNITKIGCNITFYYVHHILTSNVDEAYLLHKVLKKACTGRLVTRFLILLQSAWNDRDFGYLSNSDFSKRYLQIEYPVIIITKETVATKIPLLRFHLTGHTRI